MCRTCIFSINSPPQWKVEMKENRYFKTLESGKHCANIVGHIVRNRATHTASGILEAMATRTATGTRHAFVSICYRKKTLGFIGLGRGSNAWAEALGSNLHSSEIFLCERFFRFFEGEITQATTLIIIFKRNILESKMEWFIPPLHSTYNSGLRTLRTPPQGNRKEPLIAPESLKTNAENVGVRRRVVSIILLECSGS